MKYDCKRNELYMLVGVLYAVCVAVALVGGVLLATTVEHKITAQHEQVV